MGYTSSFAPNTSYGAEALNAIGGDFMAVANTSFVDGETYGVADLNEIRADLVTAGVAKGVGQACAVSVANGLIKVSSGRVYFANGIRAVIDDDGLSVAYTAGASGYVWLKYDATTCLVELQFTAAAPSGMYVSLATVAGGAATDCREYCCMKNASLLPNKTFAKNTIEIECAAAGATPVKTITVDASGYKNMFVKNSGAYTASAFSALVGFSPASVSGTCNGKNNYGVTCTDASKGFCVYAAAGSSSAVATYLRAELVGDQLKFYATAVVNPLTVTLDILLF